MAERYDAIVIGSGPNGLAAAITLARVGCRVLVQEAQPAIGGGARSAELTLPGFVHDICSAVHPLAVASPFFRQLPLVAHGLDWIEPPAAVAHPLDDGSAVVVERSIELTAAQLGPDANAYHQCMTRLLADWEKIASAILGPPRLPAHPVALARFARRALQSASGLARNLFKGAKAQALFAGMAAHSTLPLEKMPSAAFGLVLCNLAHAAGWPIPRNGARSISNALASYLRTLGGEIVTSAPVKTVDDLPPARAILCDVTPRQLISIAGHRLTPRFRHRLAKYRYGPGAYKVDWALDGPIPWKAPECRRAATVHLGGTINEIAASERAAWQGERNERPFVLLAQPSLFDATRSPQGMHTAWAYCHVPQGSSHDTTEQIENQVERFAPGFRSHILARSVMRPADLEHRNANLVGGDINGGVQDLPQILFRPTSSLYWTGTKGLYICSASTPPGGGVHGMCGYHAARKVLKALRE
ncbi:MAG TPA: NAD(P)/FAD-dependent oxidoreductase [Terriglobia bacterium]|nr:NAD(P)/FAD-dependent oxidoreductase [Terriglobia bacterium]